MFNEEKDLGLDIDSVEAGTGAIMLHYNLFSRIEAQKGREDVGETFSTYTVQGEKTADMKFCGYLNFKEKGAPALDTTWNGPGIVYFSGEREGDGADAAAGTDLCTGDGCQTVDGADDPGICRKIRGQL